MSPKRVLIIGPSNVGDAVLMSPVVARLHGAYPSAHLTLLVGERARAVFANDPRIRQVWRMEEWSGLAGRLRLVWAVWRLRPDALIDLRQTILPLLWKPWRLLRAFWPLPRAVTHMRERHLWRARTQDSGLRTQDEGTDGVPLWISQEDDVSVERLLVRWGVDATKRMVVICPGARSHIKRWPADRFAQVADRLIAQHRVEVVFTGEPEEMSMIQEVLRSMQHRAHNAAGSTTLQQLAALMQRAGLVLTNDSASLHLACAVHAPVLALFGPTDPRKYGPTGPQDRALQRKLFCVPCERALCRFNHECMRFLSADEVYDAAHQMLRTQDPRPKTQDLSLESRVLSPSVAPKRILVIRLDRIGDVVLSTPVLQALREAYPHAFIAMMVRPLCRELIEGNPYLNEVILYDKDGRHRGVISTMQFAMALRRYQFDTALMLHPSNRSHWIPWLAGIPVRIGYDRNYRRLLTSRLAHRKHEGTRHEADYTLDLVRALGIDPAAPRPVVPIHPQLDRRIEQRLQGHGISRADCVVAMHPSASGLSKRWKPERFAQVADRLIEERRARVVLVAGPGHEEHAHAVQRAMRHRPVNLAGALSVGELACLFRRCRVLISNDSGPVHIAAAVGTPVVDLFGRNQPGINLERWRALGPHQVILFKDVQPRRPAPATEPALSSLARKCGALRSAPPHGEYESPSLEALTVDEVYRAAVSILNRTP